MKKITLTKKDLSIALSYLIHGIDSRPTIPACSNILMEVKANKVILTTTNTDTTIFYEIPATNENEFIFLLPFAAFKSVIAVCVDEIIISHEEKIIITSGKDKYILTQTDEVDDFPRAPVLSFKKPLVLPPEFGDIIAKALVSTSTERTGSPVESIFIEIENNKLHTTSTDRILLYSKWIAIDYAGEKRTALIPVKAANILKGITDADIYFQKEFIAFKTDYATIIIRQSDGNYPEWRVMIRKDFKGEMIVERNTLLNIAHKCGLFNYQYQTIIFDISANVVNAKNGGYNVDNIANASAEIESSWEGELSYQIDYLNNALQQIDGDVIKIKINDTASLTQLIDESDPALTLLLMPFNNP